MPVRHAHVTVIPGEYEYFLRFDMFAGQLAVVPNLYLPNRLKVV